MKKLLNRIPKNLQGILWLFNFYPRKKVENTFVDEPLPVYTPPSFNFVKKYLLKLDCDLDEKAYIKSVFE